MIHVAANEFLRLLSLDRFQQSPELQTCCLRPPRLLDGSALGPFLCLESEKTAGVQLSLFDPPRIALTVLVKYVEKQGDELLKSRRELTNEEAVLAITESTDAGMLVIAPHRGKRFAAVTSREVGVPLWGMFYNRRRLSGLRPCHVMSGYVL